MSRVIRSLQFAQLCPRPNGIPETKSSRKRKKCRVAGLKYEEALAHALPFAEHGQWFYFRDLNGPGHCQSDFILRVLDQLVILETKLADAEAAREQLRYLYEPVIESALGQRPVGIAVLRHLTQLRGITGPYMIHETLREAILGAAGQPGLLAIWHWRERTPVGLGNLVPQPPIPLRSRSFAA